MKKTTPRIFLIAQTVVNPGSIVAWLEHIGVKDVQGVIRQFETATNAETLVAMAGKRCYNSFEVGSNNPNVNSIRTDLDEYITNILSSGHGSVLEHATWTFAIEGVSRVFTSEMNRHRAGVAVSEGSGRYIRFSELCFSDIPLKKANEADPMEETAKMIDEAIASQEKTYVDLCNLWKIDEIKEFKRKKELTSFFRRIIGQGVSTGGIWTINARALRHIISMRASAFAEDEIFGVFDQIATLMSSHEPRLFGDFEKTGAGTWRARFPKV